MCIKGWRRRREEEDIFTAICHMQKRLSSSEPYRDSRGGRRRQGLAREENIFPRGIALFWPQPGVLL